MPTVTLSWPAYSGVCDGFKVYRKNPAGSYGAALGTVPVTAVSYTDAAPVYGSTYTYGVFAYNLAGQSAEASTTVTVTIPLPAPVGPVTAVVNP